MLAPWKETCDNLDSVLKSRDMTLPANVHIVKAMVFPVVMYGWESWIIKKSERWRINAIELWYWRRLLRVPWTARRSNPSILKENQPWIFIGRSDAETEDPILWPSDAKSQLIGKDSDAGTDWGEEEKGVTEDKIIGCYHYLPEFAQTHIHSVDDDIQPSHLLYPAPSPPALNLSQHQSLFQGVGSSHQVAKMLEPIH